jgi:hypothetical protein
VPIQRSFYPPNLS